MYYAAKISKSQVSMRLISGGRVTDTVLGGSEEQNPMMRRLKQPGLKNFNEKDSEMQCCCQGVVVKLLLLTRCCRCSSALLLQP